MGASGPSLLIEFTDSMITGNVKSYLMTYQIYLHSSESQNLVALDSDLCFTPALFYCPLLAFEDDQLDEEDYALIAENTGIQLQRVLLYMYIIIPQVQFILCEFITPHYTATCMYIGT